MVVTRRWNTWEELLLGGAILRHGTRAWDAVASELRARTLYPYNFSPEVCKAKYEDSQRHYSNCIAWFEELRKQRVEELKQALEKSDNSIGSLETKLETLKAEEGENYVDYSLSQTESPSNLQKSEGFETSAKDTSKDGFSAGSFTQPNWSPDSHFPAAVLVEASETKPAVWGPFELEKTSSIEAILGGQLVCVRKRRGKRKRKDCNREVKESSIEENGILGSENCNLILRCSGVDECMGGSSGDSIEYLVKIFESVVENETATIFRHRLDSQKKAKYKKTIRRHVDFDTIRSRISVGTITSADELLRDLLLLTTNAIVFYSKDSSEHKAAVFLRYLAIEMLHQHDKNCIKKEASAAVIVSKPTLDKLPVKPRNIRPSLKKFTAKVAGDRKVSGADSPARKGSVKMGKMGRGSGSGGRRSGTPAKGRKRGRGR